MSEKTIEQRTIVSAILLSSDDYILLGKQARGGVYPNCWHIPGGGVDGVESHHQALIREIDEEVGLDISHYSAELVSDSDSDIAMKTNRDTGEKRLVSMNFFVYLVKLPMRAQEITVRLHDDLVTFRWVKKANLSRYKHTPPSNKLFQKLGWL